MCNFCLTSVASGLTSGQPPVFAKKSDFRSFRSEEIKTIFFLGPYTPLYTPIYPYYSYILTSETSRIENRYRKQVLSQKLSQKFSEVSEVKTPDDLPPPLREEWEERAAIMEEGDQVPRDTAEHRALRRILDRTRGLATYAGNGDKP